MNRTSYYRDHWLDVDPDRVQGYEEMFRWRPQMAPLLAPADLREGQTVVDYGCGPGMLSLELARRVGSSGRVLALDINTDFLKRGRELAEKEGVADRIDFRHVQGAELPLESASVDGVVCKNVLEYVDDPDQTLAEFRRALRPGGIAHAIDSDWGLLVIEPLAPERLEQIMQPARIAFRTPLIGRQLHGRMRRAGFATVDVRVIASADTQGNASPVFFNMCKYALESGDVHPSLVETLRGEVERAIENGEYMLLLPQFLVTGAV